MIRNLHLMDWWFEIFQLEFHHGNHQNYDSTIGSCFLLSLILLFKSWWKIFVYNSTCLIYLKRKY